MSAVRTRLPPPLRFEVVTNSAVVRHDKGGYEGAMMDRSSLLVAVAFAALCLPCPAETKRPDPVRFAKEIAKFDSDDAANPPAHGGIVFTGSSSVRMWKVNEAFPDLPVLNR